MSWSIAELWDTPESKEIAENISQIGGYCGPAVVVWIAAVWNLHKGRSYDYKGRYRDKDLFPDGPRNFHGDGPSALNWQASLNSILKRETNNELQLSENTFYRYNTIHERLEEYDMPLIIRMMGPGFINQLHYVTLYKSRKKIIDWGLDEVKFYWQDNGFYGRRNGGNPGLYGSDWGKILPGSFGFGAKRVVRA